MNEKTLIGRLKKAQQELALHALLRPAQKDLFTLGQASGMVIGLEAAVDEVLKILSEERDDGNDL